MSERDDNEPAFPYDVMATDSLGVERTQASYPGMYLRDYFAAKAMEGILAGPCARDGVTVKEWGDVPQYAYEIADAMLDEREK